MLQPPLGPPPCSFLGTYALEGASNVTIGRLPESSGGWLYFSLPGLVSFYLDFAGSAVPNAYRAWIPPHTLACMNNFEMAIGGEYVLFEVDGAGVAVSVSMPGWIPGATWTR